MVGFMNEDEDVQAEIWLGEEEGQSENGTQSEDATSASEEGEVKDSNPEMARETEME